MNLYEQSKDRESSLSMEELTPNKEKIRAITEKSDNAIIVALWYFQYGH